MKNAVTMSHAVYTSVSVYCPLFTVHVWTPLSKDNWENMQVSLIMIDTSYHNYNAKITQIAICSSMHVYEIAVYHPSLETLIHS